MAAERGTLERWYRARIGSPTTDGEAKGYWVFALGTVAGVVGILLFLASTPASGLREASVVIAAVGLVLLVAGPVVRLPLRRSATVLTAIGVALSLLGVLWFAVVFPGDWSTATGETAVVALYTAGLVVVAIGGVLVPVATGPAGAARDRRSVTEELADLRQSLADASADEADLADVVTELREMVADLEADEADLAAELRRARAALADATADEADLAAELVSMRASQARFELYEDAGGEWRWRLRHRNGNVVADSGQGYTQKHNAQNGMESVRRNAYGATVLQYAAESDLEPADEAFEPFAERESQATFEVFEDAAGEYRWRLVHENGNVLADSGEGYADRRGARRGVESVRRNADPADYLRFDPVAFETFRDAGGEWRWRLVHRNGNILADGGEGYATHGNARRAVRRLRERAGEYEAEVYEDAAGEYRWRLISSNDTVVADSGEGYASRDGARDALDRVRDYAPDAAVLEVGPAAFEVFEDAGGEWRWRLRHRNGNIIADSGEGYAERRNAYDGIERVKRHAPGAETGP